MPIAMGDFEFVRNLPREQSGVVLEAGKWKIRDVQERFVSWPEVAAEAYDGRKMPANLERGLEATYYWEPPNETFPFSAHVCVVTIDKRTGRVKIEKYVSVDDCGNIVNPMLVHGQVHGGLAQGIGQALLEEVVYNNQGQLISNGFIDYPMLDYPMLLPETFPMFMTENTVTPTSHNPMGAKGVGEAGTIGAPPAVVGAVIDALSHLGVTHIDVPLRSAKIWRILKEHNTFQNPR